VKPAIKDIRSLEDNEIEPYLRGKFDFEASQVDTNFNFLMMLGEKARQVKPALIDKAVSSWLAEPPNSKRADVAAWFLFGYWTADRPLHEPLVEALVSMFDDSASGPAPQPAFLFPLRIAYNGQCSAKTKAAIHAAFLKLASKFDTSKWPEAFRSPLQGVIGKP
jgi:hypothetical protein